MGLHILQLQPKKISNISQASTIKGAFKHGKQVYPDELENIDLILVGSVAVNKKGAKIGKGGGFSDLEYALGREFGFVTETTPTVTTVHPLQLIEHEIPMETHDVPMDYIITSTTVIHTKTVYPKPDGVKWEILGNKINEIPALKKIFERKQNEK